MKLALLLPIWLTPNLFVFRCPHCYEAEEAWLAKGERRHHVWLSVKNKPMDLGEQSDIICFRHVRPKKIDGKHCLRYITEPTPDNAVWNWTHADENDIVGTLTVAPTIQILGHGHWQIEAGEVTEVVEAA